LIAYINAKNIKIQQQSSECFLLRHSVEMHWLIHRYMLGSAKELNRLTHRDLFHHCYCSSHTCIRYVCAEQNYGCDNYVMLINKHAFIVIEFLGSATNW